MLTKENFIKESGPLIFIYALTTLIIVGIHAFSGYSYYVELDAWGKIARCISAFITGVTVGLFLALIKQLLINKILKSIFDYVFYLSAVVIGFVECFCVVKFESLYNSALVMQIFTTDAAETKDFLGVYMDFVGISTLLLFIVLGIICRFSGNILYIILSFFRKNLKFSLAIFLILVATLIIGKVKLFKEYETIPAVRLYNAFHYINKTRSRMKQLADSMKNDIVIKEDNSTIPNIIFIIGESESRHFMSLYGYNKPTTPFCDNYEKVGNLVKMTDVISAQAVTGFSTNLVLTFLNNETKNKSIAETNNFINALKKCGYTAYWASNQTLYGVDVSYLSYCSKLCDFSTYTVRNFNAEHVNGLRKTDDELVNILDGYLKDSKGNKNFYFFHLLGSHYDYKHRYPSSFQKFNPEDIENTYTQDQKKVIANYLNSILFTDYVLNEIIKRFENKNAILIYISDHGEELWQAGFCGHSATNTSKWMLDIPMFFWFSNEFKKVYPDKVDKIKSASNKPFMIDDIIHVVLDLSDIKTTEYDASRSVINDAYIQRERVINGTKYEDLRR